MLDAVLLEMREQLEIGRLEAVGGVYEEKCLAESVVGY